MATSGATPVGEDTTLSDIAGQGQYNTLSSLYQGLTASAASRRQADIDLFGAQNVESAAPIAAAGTVLAGSQLVRRQAGTHEVLHDERRNAARWVAREADVAITLPISPLCRR